MQIILQPNDWACDLCAHAMVLGLTYDEMIKAVGHDGSKIIRPDEKHPFDVEAFHSQQLDYVCIKKGHVAMYTPRREKAFPEIVSGHYWSDEEFYDFIKNKIGILVVKSKRYKEGYHCVAWNGEKIYDPRGGIHSIDCYDVVGFKWVRKLHKYGE